MLTYAPSSPDSTAAPRPEKPWLLILLCLLWLLPGLIGHDPWKPGENQTAEIVRQFLLTDRWVIPKIAGLPYLEQAPLYYWIAALLAKPLVWLGLSMHDAARLSTGLWMALAFTGVGFAGYALHGRHLGRLSVVILLSCVGLLTWGHLATPAVVALAAFCWQFYALALMPRRPLPAGALLGACWLVLFIGASWAECALSLVMTFALLAFPTWRKSGFLLSLAAALVIVLPLGVLWPLALSAKMPEVYHAWWSQAAWGPFSTENGLSLFHAPGYLFSIAAWFAWPALPLATWAIWSHRRELREPRFQLLLLMLVLMAGWLAMAASPGERQALILLPVLALIATPGIDDLRRGGAAAFNWFGILTFGGLALALWLGWLVMLIGWPQGLAQDLRAHSPDFMPGLGGRAVFAVLLTAGWISVLLHKRAFGRRALVAWACGVTLFWGLLIGLWQGWLDVSKSYRNVGEDLTRVVPAGACVRIEKIDETRLAALSYFSQIDLRLGDADCAFSLLHGDEAAAGAFPGELRWIGARSGEKNERFYLYRRER